MGVAFFSYICISNDILRLLECGEKWDKTIMKLRVEKPGINKLGMKHTSEQVKGKKFYASKGRVPCHPKIS
ncbi:hypothetical protein Q8G35_09680 [Peribacillus simplex]|uniref:Uncharacterized protein n=2 Tax=Peribacillus TaxID=2675229 RepID=A0AA90T081_9BACI|nr:MULTISPECIES: hypothetical protein [Peribacillus]MDP1418679.1 hypothetical protein [Peribacillus simplex]MDP1450734.1 hypothetical protein [Peribacillus frigoritolerans]